VTRRPLRIAVMGYLVRGPFGGMAWHHLQYVSGLARLGHEVLFVEDSEDYESCYDPRRGCWTSDPQFGLRFAGAAFEAIGELRWAYHDAHTGTWHGPAGEEAAASCAGADVVLNVSGVNPVRPWWAEVPVRVFIDTDPAFVQIRHLQEPAARELASAHTAWFSFAESIGSAGCTVPDDGFPWRPTRQPVVADLWPVRPASTTAPFTTVMQWDAYPPREHDGRRYGLKSDAFEPYWPLPHRCHDERFVLAVGSPTAPREELAAAGWGVEDPLEIAPTPAAYQEWIASSKGEFSVAKSGYVDTRSGWFSERSAGYLASGRPVLVQDTGFSEHLPTGTGLVPFSTLDEAVAGVADINARYDEHCRAARRIAEEHFDSGRVLTELLEAALS
jgi:hypothetical protein